MIEIYPFLMSNTEYDEDRQCCRSPEDFAPNDVVELVMKFDQESNFKAARMFAAFSSLHKPGNLYDAVSLTLLHTDPSDDEEVRLRFDSTGLWTTPGADSPFEVYIDYESADALEGYILEPTEEEYHEFENLRDDTHDYSDQDDRRSNHCSEHTIRPHVLLWAPATSKRR